MKKINYLYGFLLLAIIGINYKISAVQLPTYYPKDEYIFKYLDKMPWESYKAHYVPEITTWFWVGGYNDCVKDTVRKGKVWEPYIVDLLKKFVKKGDTVIDVGAHIGTITFAMSNLVESTGKVLSFEADLTLFRELYWNIYSNLRTNIFPYLIWLGDKNEEKEMTGSSYDINWIREYRTLDSFNLDNIALMKIDIESTEDEFLEGAKETIARSRPILIIEIRGGCGWNPNPEMNQKIQHTIQTLESMDYIVKKILIDDYLALPK
ncbi:MAG: FkbM family methyltransferase [Chlamydiales bacterium]